MNRIVASSFLLDLTRIKVDIAMNAKVVASMASINPRASKAIVEIATRTENTEVLFTTESSGRADTHILPKTAAVAAATGRITNFPVSIIASSAKVVAEKNSRSIPASTAGVETSPLNWPTSFVFPFS